MFIDLDAAPDEQARQRQAFEDRVRHRLHDHGMPAVDGPAEVFKLIADL